MICAATILPLFLVERHNERKAGDDYRQHFRQDGIVARATPTVAANKWRYGLGNAGLNALD